MTNTILKYSELMEIAKEMYKKGFYDTEFQLIYETLSIEKKSIVKQFAYALYLQQDKNTSVYIGCEGENLLAYEVDKDSKLTLKSYKLEEKTHLWSCFSTEIKMAKDRIGYYPNQIKLF